MISPQRSFRTLKQLVSIEHVLAHRQLIARMRRRGNDLVGPCPIHHGDNPMAFVVSRSKNLWRCFTGCDAGGDVVELVRRLDQTSYARVAEYLADLARLPLPPVFNNGPCHSSPRPFVPFQRYIPLDPEADLLRCKAIHPKTARHFEVGLYQGRGFLQRSVGVRLHDPQGSPLGYAARHLQPCDIRCHGKWKFPPRFPKNRLLYNFHRIRAHNPKTLVLVECPWGVMRLHQIAIPAVALLGTHLSSRQHQLLLPISHLIVMMDGDPAGRQAATRISQQLYAHPELSIASVPDGLDPDQLTDDRLKAILRPFLF
ncbi:MAG: CHC2 zinc finger domain-containing protein [candidate division NC10 bacterium]